MDEQSIHGHQEPLERSCKRALDFDTRNAEKDDKVVEAVNIPVYKIQSADSFPRGRTILEDQNSSKKLGSSSVPSKNLHANVFPYFFNSVLQMVFQYHLLYFRSKVCY